MVESINRALVTGGSGGIGYELACCLASDGYELILVSRDEANLKSAAAKISDEYGIRVQYFVADLTNSSAVEELYRKLESEGITISILINNAGFGAYGLFSDISLEKQMNMIQLNVMSLTRLTGLFLPSMIKRGYGRILNVASTAAFQPGPLMAVYYASKAYVLSFSEALANELQGTGVTVSTLCPGPTPTRFQEVAGMGNSKLIHRSLLVDAKTVAKIGYSGMMKGKNIIIPGVLNKALAFAVRISPRKSVAAVARWIQESRR